jgi:uncharacterized membrane-anchored protein YhcB (DUF1043 family)
MNANFYSSDTFIAMIAKHFNNADDLKKIANACECMYESLTVANDSMIPPLTINQLLVRAAVEKEAQIMV